METVVITGAAGRIGRTIAPLLARAERRLVLLDHAVPPDAAGPGEWVEASITDRDALRSGFEGADAVVHLAGIASEHEWESILATNIDGTEAVLASARAAGVTRVLLASSIHASGYRTADDLVEHPALARPDTYYGVSKAAMEALGSLYADRFGMSVVSARICTFLDAPDAGRTLASWLSPADIARLVEAAVVLDSGRHHLVWAVSANAPDWFPLDEGFAIGFAPQDDAARWLTERGHPEPVWPPRDAPLGGSFLDLPLGGGHAP